MPLVELVLEVEEVELVEEVEDVLLIELILLVELVEVVEEVSDCVLPLGVLARRTISKSSGTVRLSELAFETVWRGVVPPLGRYTSTVL